MESLIARCAGVCTTTRHTIWTRPTQYFIISSIFIVPILKMLSCSLADHIDHPHKDYNFDGNHIHKARVRMQHISQSLVHTSHLGNCMDTCKNTQYLSPNNHFCTKYSVEVRHSCHTYMSMLENIF